MSATLLGTGPCKTQLFTFSLILYLNIGIPARQTKTDYKTFFLDTTKSVCDTESSSRVKFRPKLLFCSIFSKSVVVLSSDSKKNISPVNTFFKSYVRLKIAILAIRDN